MQPPALRTFNGHELTKTKKFYVFFLFEQQAQLRKKDVHKLKTDPLRKTETVGYLSGQFLFGDSNHIISLCTKLRMKMLYQAVHQTLMPVGYILLHQCPLH